MSWAHAQQVVNGHCRFMKFWLHDSSYRFWPDPVRLCTRHVESANRALGLEDSLCSWMVVLQCWCSLLLSMRFLRLCWGILINIHVGPCLGHWGPLVSMSNCQTRGRDSSNSHHGKIWIKISAPPASIANSAMISIPTVHAYTVNGKMRWQGRGHPPLYADSGLPRGIRGDQLS